MDTHADRLLGRLIRDSAIWTAAIAVVTLAGAVAETLFPAVLGGAVDAVLREESAATPIMICAALVAITVLCSAIGEWGTGSSTARATAFLRRRMIEHVLAAGTRRFPTGDLVSRVAGGASDAGGAPAATATAAASLIPVAGGLVALALIDPWLLVAFVGGIPAIAALLLWFVRRTSDLTTEYLSVQGSVAARLVDALTGSRTIAASGTVDRECDRVLTPLPRLNGLGHQAWLIQARAQSRAVLLVPMLQIIVLTVAGFGLLAGRISPGEMLAAGQYVLLAAGVGPITGAAGRIARARAGARRAVDVFGERPISYGLRRLPPGPGRLEFRNVVREGVLHGIDLTVPGGSCVALVGASGAGKSTLAGLCGRLTEPDAGEVLLDGVPVSDLEREELRREVVYAFDRPALLGEHIGDVIDFGLDDPAPSERRAAARAACVDHVIRRLPHGYETPVGEAPLSGGETQRVGLARAFAHAGRVLVLDDATSSLDTATELQVSTALAGALGDRTRIIVAHRAATAARADLVAWLDGGRVRAYGPHGRLWRDPDYREAFR